MTWKPTEGLRRTHGVLTDIENAAAACDIPLTGWAGYHLLRHRMQDIISKALDQALTDGSEQDALDKMVGGNGHHIEVVSAGAGSYSGATSHKDPEAMAQYTRDVDVAPKKRGRPKGSKRGRRPKADEAVAS